MYWFGGAFAGFLGAASLAGVGYHAWALVKKRQRVLVAVPQMMTYGALGILAIPIKPTDPRVDWAHWAAGILLVLAIALVLWDKIQSEQPARRAY